MAEPGRYFAAGSMDLVTTIIGSRFDNKDYIDHSSNEQNQCLHMDSVENVYYINDGIFGSFANIPYEQATFSVSSLRKQNVEPTEDEERKYRSTVFGPTCDSSDCLTVSVDLPLLTIGDNLYFYHIGAYSNSCSMKFNGFQTTKYFYIYKD